MLYFPHGKEDHTGETLAAQLSKMDARMEKGYTAVEVKIDKLEGRMDRGFAAVAEDIGDIRDKMATKGQIITLHTQVTSIETQLRDMKHTKLHARVADLEEKVFGVPRR